MGFANPGRDRCLGRLLSRDTRNHMTSRNLLLHLGTFFAAAIIAVAGCIGEQEAYPNGQARPPGGINLSDGEAICGDGKIDLDELCDDGNQSNGDGCSSTCQVEECWDCSLDQCLRLKANTPCSGAKVCDGNGVCVACIPVEMACDKCKNCPGSTCDEVNDCASMACVTGVCRSANGSACVDPVQCASGSCSGGATLLLCASCTDGTQCTSGACDSTTGTCLAAMGEPCDDSVKCASGLQCSAINICQGIAGAPCSVNQQCASNFCFIDLGGCYNCSEGKACLQGGICTNGVCSPVNLPEGAYCVNSADCASQKCTGFPRRCASL
jgi:cysteine-rich repeat protein